MAPTHHYGKGDVFVYRTYAQALTEVASVPESSFTGRTNTIMAASVDVIVRGDAFLKAYTDGDNRDIVATDSMKNFIQRHAARYEGATLEGFLHYVGRRFLETYPQMSGLTVTARELPFQAATIPGGKVSDLLFRRSRDEYAVAGIDLNRSGGSIELGDHWAGLKEIQLIKVSGNSFADFVRDEYTTLPQLHDRALFIYLDLKWRYADGQAMVKPVPDGYVPAEQVCDIVQAVFHERESKSIQELIYQMGLRLLERFPQIAEVEMEGQNRTWDTVVERSEGSQARVLTEPRPPYGIIGLRLRREDLA